MSVQSGRQPDRKPRTCKKYNIQILSGLQPDRTPYICTRQNTPDKPDSEIACALVHSYEENLILSTLTRGPAKTAPALDQCSKPIQEVSDCDVMTQPNGM